MLSSLGWALSDMADAVVVGQRLGADAFWDYMQKFGIVGTDGAGTGTGIDLPGESKSIFWSRDSFNIVNLATASFGQRFQVTPIQLITAANAVINGGYYYQPYVVDSVTAADGTVTYSNVGLGGPYSYPTSEKVTISGFTGDFEITITDAATYMDATYTIYTDEQDIADAIAFAEEMAKQQYQVFVW